MRAAAPRETKYDAAAVMAIVCEAHGERGQYLHEIAEDLAKRGTPVSVTTIKRYAKLAAHADDWQCAKEAHADWHVREMRAAIDRHASDVPLARLYHDDAKWKASHADWRAYGDKHDITSDYQALAPGVMLLPMTAWGRPEDNDPEPA